MAESGEFFVKSEIRLQVGWHGPYATAEAARRVRDNIRNSGGYALVHRSTVATRAEVAAWKAANHG